jgi:hypothetical protein
MAQCARWMRLAYASGGERQAACARLAASQSVAADPIVVWLRAAERRAFALIAPQRLAPGRVWRWPAWGAMPAIAACRLFGVPAYLERDAIWVHGRRIAAIGASRIGACVVIEGEFPRPLAAEPRLEEAFRERVEAQHGWRFDTAWPSGGEARR